MTDIQTVHDLDLVDVFAQIFHTTEAGFVLFIIHVNGSQVAGLLFSSHSY